VGISVDAPAANGAFAKANGLQFPLLSDWNRETIRAYDIVHVGLGGVEGYTSAMRSVFILDKEGVVRYKWVAEQQGNEPNYDEVTKALNSFA
jgi:peroxiredoxin